MVAKKDPVKLSPEQEEVVRSRGEDLHVVACAGSGKTESISRRVAGLIQEDTEPASVVAFTFTERAAAELKERIYQHVETTMGKEFLGRLGPMYVGTIHGYCFHLLQDHVPTYGNYDVLDEHKHIGLLSREYQKLKLHQLGSAHWQPIRDFAQTVDLMSNELIDPALLAGTSIGDCCKAYQEMLDRFRFLTFGQIIAKTVEVLKNPVIFARVHGPLRHLIVDEYQDINPAQEKLIEMLATSPVQLCVVGDDDQSIYQWRGADNTNILTFAQRRRGTRTIKLETNRRSRPDIIAGANVFAQSIPNRLDKAMKPDRLGGKVEVVSWKAETEAREVEQIAETIQRLHENGYRYRDIAVLYRSVRTSAPALIQALEDRGIPYQCGGRTGLFMQPEIGLFGEVFAWFVDGNWKDARFGAQRPATLNDIVAGLSQHFGKDGVEIPGLRKYLDDWRSYRLRSNRPVSLVGDFYRLLNFLGAQEIDVNTPDGSARFGAFARFSTILADFEHVTRRGRYVDEGGQRVFRGGQDRGKPYYQRLHNYLLHYARDAYEDFEGEQTLDVDAVDILTVHQAKGLEWQVVFIPALTNLRFPSKYAGSERDWLLPESVFPVTTRRRYEGGDADERRLFYVAMTRARDTVYLSYFSRIQRAVKPSPYLEEVAANRGGIRVYDQLPLPDLPGGSKVKEPPVLETSFSDIASYDECAYRYRLAKMFGFEQELAIELGYGKAIHHVLRHVAEQAYASGKAPSWDEATRILDAEFYLPFADNPTFNRMMTAAGGVVQRYLGEYAEDLQRVFAIERPFEVHLADGIVAGKADIILDREGGNAGQLAIVDYKSSHDPMREERYALQIAVYAVAGRGEGLNVSAGFLHDLNDGARRDVDISEDTTKLAVEKLAKSVAGIRHGKFNPCAQAERCGMCDYRFVCRHNAAPEPKAPPAPAPHTEEAGEPEVQGFVMQRLLHREKPDEKREGS